MTHYQCDACGIKIPVGDVQKYQAGTKCPFCKTGSPFEEERLIDVNTASKTKTKPTKTRTAARRWTAIENKDGKTYYHNAETGEDRWTKPADFDAPMAVKNEIIKGGDAVKDAVLKEERQLKAKKLGLEIESPAQEKERAMQRARARAKAKLAAAANNIGGDDTAAAAAAAASTASDMKDDSFVAAQSFEGARQGFVFKSGGQGLGYYRDCGELAGTGTSNDPASVGMLGALLPLIGACTGVASIFTVYYLTAKYGHLPPGVATPPISFLGCETPEHEAYQLGFALTGAMLAVCVRIFHTHLHPLLRRPFPACAACGLFGGYAASFGVIGQGVITLESGLLHKLNTGEQIGVQSVVHQLVAAFFFLGAAAHCYGVTYAYWRCASTSAAGGAAQQQQQQLLLLSRIASGSKFSKALFVATSFAAGPIAQALHPAATLSDDRREFNIAGVAQYVAVGSYICFFGTYTLDFMNLGADDAKVKKMKTQ